jgi:hypothetical protein
MVIRSLKTRQKNVVAQANAILQAVSTEFARETSEQAGAGAR